MAVLYQKTIVELAFAMTQAVGNFAERVRKYFYAVMLSSHTCPKCEGDLEMGKEGECRCRSCGYAFDPTIVFQHCPDCSGQPKLVVRHYQCSKCGAGIRSRFLFDGLIFDTDYFRQKMVESRQRKREQRERVRQMLAESRSEVIQPPVADLDSIPGLLQALNALTLGLDENVALPQASGFNLKRYQSHIQAHLQPFPITLCEIPPLSENARKDKIWRFVAIIFLAHTGIVDICQDGQDIMVRKNETDTEGSGIPGDVEAVDGFEGAIGRIEA